MKLPCLIAITVSIGCSSHDSKSGAKTAQEPVPTNKVVEPAKPAEPTLSAELTKLAAGGKLQAGPFAWPKGGNSAVVSSGDRALLVWAAGAESGTVSLPRAAATGEIKDVTKDGNPELVVFAAPPTKPLEWFDDPTMTWIIGIFPQTSKPARMWLLETQVIGATDAASLDRELATVGTFGDPKASPVKLIARLANATPAELQALVGKAGLKLCKRQGEKKSCKPIAQKALDAKRLTEIVNRGGVIATFGAEEVEGEALQPPACQVDDADPKRLLCISSVGGPSGGQWVFEKTDAGLRLAEVWDWAEDS